MMTNAIVMTDGAGQGVRSGGGGARAGRPARAAGGPRARAARGRRAARQYPPPPRRSVTMTDVSAKIGCADLASRIKWLLRSSSADGCNLND